MDEETQALRRAAPIPGPGLVRRLLAGVRRAWDGAPATPSSIGRYRVVRKIGEGGMGSVFEAVDEVLGRRIAIKRLKAVDASARRRFWREARAAARLNHPNVCALFEVGEDASGPFLAMELLSGEPLSARLRRGPMEIEDVVPLGAGMLAALQAIHDSGLVHRDLKPSNVYLTPHGPRLLDFGLVRAMQSQSPPFAVSDLATPYAVASDDSITDPQLLIGTPRYMAPEQLLDRGRWTAAPICSGSAPCSYEAVAGRRRSPAAHRLEVFYATLHIPPPPLAGSCSTGTTVLRRALSHGSRSAVRHRAGDGGRPPRGRLPTARAAPPAPGRRRVRGGELFGRRRTGELGWLDERLAAALSGGQRRLRHR